MSSSEDEGEGNGRAKVMIGLLTRSCKALLDTAIASEEPISENLEAKGLWIYSSKYIS